MRTLVAWIGEKRIGEFTETHEPEGHLFAFEYDEITERDVVSLTMVPEAGQLRFETRAFPPPFDMILPEGERRRRIEDARKILRTDAFSLLSYVGANPVNRVRFLAPGRQPDADVPELPTPREIAGCAEGEKLFARLMENLDLRQGIAGVQPKILGAPSADKLSLAMRNLRGSTYILKSSSPKYPFLATNEHACLEVFRAAGLTTANSTLSADGHLLMVERFDIRDEHPCLGFEEAAALMGETSDTKYQRDYGSMIESLAKFVAPAAEEALRRDVTKAVVINHMIGNGDAHLKNFGVVYNDVQDVALSPFFDCISTLPYIPDDIPALALSFEWYSKAWWPRTRIEEFARTYGALDDRQISQLIDEAAAGVEHGIEVVGRLAREIPAFQKLGGEMARLWNDRVTAFRAEESGLKVRRASR